MNNINPHIWRKFQQAQTNMMKRLGFTRIGIVGNSRRWNGNRTTRKSRRRAVKWARTMRRLNDKLFGVWCLVFGVSIV